MHKKIDSDISFKKILRIAPPSFISMFSINIMQFVDRTMVARFDLEQFSAIMPAGIFALTVSSVFLGIIGYVSVLVSQYWGARKYEDCAFSMWQGFYLSIGFTVILIILSPVLGMCFRLFGHDANLASFERGYFYLLVASSCIQLFPNCISGFFSGTGDTRTPMAVTIFSNLLNILLDWIFVFGKFGFPPSGIIGAGVATLIATASAFVILVVILLTKKWMRLKYRVFHRPVINLSIIGKMVRFGFPSGFQFFLGISSFSIFLLLIGRMGNDFLKLANIAFSIEGISFIPVLGLSTGVCILVGQERGAGRLHNIPVVIRKGIQMALVYNAIMIILFNLIPDILISIFNGGKNGDQFREIIRMTIPLIRLSSLWLIFDSVSLILSESLKSMGDTLFLMIVNAILPYVLMILPAYLILFVWKGSLVVVWGVVVVYVMLFAAVMTARYLQGKWKRIRVIG